MHLTRIAHLFLLLAVVVTLAGCAGTNGGAPVANATATATATVTPEPISPTRTATPEKPPPRQPTATPEPRPTLPPEPTTRPEPAAAANVDRVGLTGEVELLEAALATGLPFGHFANWNLMAEPPDLPNVTYWQMVRLDEAGVVAAWSDIEAVIAARPGSFWLVGNEPDVRWQDGVTAARYAELYHDVYTFIKARDPEARVGAGGISLATPLRLAYLDEVLSAYEARTGQALPADLWSLHAFVLREETDSWGIGIPTGRDETAGLLYEIDDHGDLSLMTQHVRDFRAWMARNGYRDTPLAVTEFGILLPHDYGFPPDFVAGYLHEAFDFFDSAAGQDGYPADGGRLVQWWFWYSLYDDGAYPTGNLLDGPGGGLTEVGQAYVEAVTGQSPAQP